MEITHDLFLSLGSNLGNRKKNILLAYEAIEKNIGQIWKKSSFYENEAVGFQSNTLFLNTCILVKTNLPPKKILRITQRIEKEQGRVKSTNGYTNRPIDIDLIFYDQLILKTNDLILPHPHYSIRKFVLIPLLEIAPDFQDPITFKSPKELLEL